MPNVKIYQIDEDQGGIVRDNGKDVKSFKDAKGYFCTSGEDFRKIIQACQQGSSQN